MLLLTYLIGPVTFITRKIRRDAADHMLHAGKRWSTVWGSALVSLLWYVPVVYLHAPLAEFWSFLFATYAHWLHLPILALLGGTSIWQPTPMSMLLRWLLALPLAPLLACVLESIQPKTTWEVRRVVTPDEQLELAAASAAQEKKKTRSAQKRSATKLPTVRGPHSSSRQTTKPSAPQLPVIPPADSLWGTIDWSKVLDTHPVKVAAMQEAERNRWVAGQMAKQSQTPPLPVALTQPPDSVQADDKGYDWNQGEGTAKDF